MTNHTAYYTLTSGDEIEQREVLPGDTIKDFRGTHWGFIEVTRGPEFEGRSPKVKVSDGLGGTREFYSTVFPGLEVI